MVTILDTVRAQAGPPFDAHRYPRDYALDLLLGRDLVPAGHVSAAEVAVRARLRPGVKRGPDRRAVLAVALQRWCTEQGEDLSVICVALADKYLELHSIAKP